MHNDTKKQYIDMLNEIEKKRVKPRFPYFRYTVMGLLFILPLILTENMVASCVPCQWLVGMMSSLVPGISVMSNASKIPQIVSLELSVMWIMIPLFFGYSIHTQILNREWLSEALFYKKWMFILGYMFLVLVIWYIFFGSHNFYNGLEISDSSSHYGRHKFFAVNNLIQSQFGIGIFAVIWGTVIIPKTLSLWLFMNWSLIKKIKG